MHFLQQKSSEPENEDKERDKERERERDGNSNPKIVGEICKQILENSNYKQHDIVFAYLYICTFSEFTKSL